MTATGPTLDHLDVIFFDVAPWETRYDWWQGKEVDTLSASLPTLPTPFLDALMDLYAHPDTAQCANCQGPVGFTLRQRGDREALEWTITGLARHSDGPVLALCEGCTPFVPRTAAR